MYSLDLLFLCFKVFIILISLVNIHLYIYIYANVLNYILFQSILIQYTLHVLCSKKEKNHIYYTCMY